MIEDAHGNLLDADAEMLVNTVNTVGVMGKGIALQFKRAFPENYKAYKRACDTGRVELGHVLLWDAGGLHTRAPRFIANFPTKGHWRSKSRLADIETGLTDLIDKIRATGVRSVAVPPLGCGNGGLDWAIVKPLIQDAFSALPEVRVLLFGPEGAPAPAEQPVRTERPRMSAGRAAMIAIMERYLPYAVEITAVDIQKLMYFVQEAGEPLRLNYVKARYGPYADNLRHVLSSMEGHFIRGTGDGSAGALEAIPFEVLPGASDAATETLASQPSTNSRIGRVLKLVEDFESTYGLELLATVHWAATRAGEERRLEPASPEETSRIVSSWSWRKGVLFTAKHVELAYERLLTLGWLDAPPDPHLSLFA